ncbi:hypothetical protein [Candidatus Methanocrinis natronophilus]|uniref:Uncharacterized protein n=1 Tax=Candidatus Methanocrinis natronophilus TaxID=3033396 RepID=A0ABT5X5F0_9EURY|nr:hypothetical protein [Candidatus Methanocrinis natronophilus]MDF0589921.1 hypothetical protein [Candidatus Methanocrinis natronophilus]
MEIPILGLDCTGGGPCGIDSIRDSVSILGYVLNAREEAVRYQEWHDRYVGPVEARISEIPQRERVRVYLESTSDTI